MRALFAFVAVILVIDLVTSIFKTNVSPSGFSVVLDVGRGSEFFAHGRLHESSR